MRGLVLNTHSQWLGRQLSDAGYNMARQTAVADTGPAIQQAVRESLGRAEFIIVTGGLGPTSDDLTRDLIAALLGKKLVLDTAILSGLEKFFTRRGRPMPASTKVQAQVPEGAVVLENPNGTAPGLAMKCDPNPFRADAQPAWLVMLPGPPREMRPMFTNLVLPLLRREFPLTMDFACLTLRTTGIAESLVEEKISSPLQPLIGAGLELGYCAHSGHVDVRLVAQGNGAGELVVKGGVIVREKLGADIYGTQDEQLNAVVVRLLKQRGETLALAESCTGGHIANRITDVPGASAVFLGGVVSYSNQVKENLLGVSAQTLAEHGAVSDAVARGMAQGARDRLKTDYALAVTGIAGPDGGTPEKPVGTVFIALATPRHTFVINPTNRFDRENFKVVTTQQALDLLRRALLKDPPKTPAFSENS